MFAYSDRVLRAATRVAPLRHLALGRVSREAAAVLELGEEKGFGFRVLGRAPMIGEPLFTGDWWVVPAQMDTAPIPAEVKPQVIERVRAIYSAGLRPKGWVIAHETPRLLAAPKVKSGQPPTPWWKRYWLTVAARPAAVGALAVALVVLGPIIAAALMAVLIKVAVVMAAILAIPAAVLGLGAVSAVDPVLVMVTEDNVWIEIHRWV